MSDNTAEPTVLYETRGPVALLTLNRPDKLNAIDARMVRELGEALDRAEADDAVRCVVLQGAGRAFSAGFDLEMGDPGDGDKIEFLRTELEHDLDVILRFWDSPKVTIAAVHTYCLGSGMELAVACDITLAAEGCRFGAPEVKFGSGIVALILPWVMGHKQAKGGQRDARVARVQPDPGAGGPEGSAPLAGGPPGEGLLTATRRPDPTSASGSPAPRSARECR
jgi:enoyl-CoA hydratase/carnithine racemase